MTSESLKILHLIDSLRAGGAEILAVNIADALNKRGIHAYLMATRAEGPLKNKWKYPEKYFFLKKKYTLDLVAFWKLYQYIKENNIDFLHAHTNSYFMAAVIKIFRPSLKVVWHNHTGKNIHLKGKKLQSLKFFSRFFDGIIHVNNDLLKWGQKTFAVKHQLVLSHFPVLAFSGKEPYLNVPKGKRIIHVGGWRPVKDHPTLLKAFKKVLEKHPDATLHLIGPVYGDAYEKKVRQLIKDLGLEKSVYIHGTQTAIGDWLKGAYIGVLSSQSEGLPVSLLEYGLAGLPVVTTTVGEIPAVLENGKYGKLVPPGDADALANAITNYLDNPEEARKTGEAFRRHVEANYSEEGFMDKLIHLYNELLKE